jgi:hypothetical protein
MPQTCNIKRTEEKNVEQNIHPPGCFKGPLNYPSQFSHPDKRSAFKDLNLLHTDSSLFIVLGPL